MIDKRSWPTYKVSDVVASYNIHVAKRCQTAL